MAAVVEAEERITSVQIEGLVSAATRRATCFLSRRRFDFFLIEEDVSFSQALLKIVKHCHESLPHMVTGSLLGLAVENGVLEITHAFPFPSDGKQQQQSEDDEGLEGHEYQLEMMRMLREVNVDNNCVGWYQSMYLGIYSTSTLLENQLSYQTDLSPNAVVILYDPMQTSHGNLVLKCYRLTEEYIELREAGENAFINPKDIFEQIPVRLTNPALVQALLVDVADGVHNADPAVAGGDEGFLYDKSADTTFDRLDLSTNPYLEKHLEFLCGWVDELAAEQHKFQYYSRQLARGGEYRRKGRERQDEEGGWASTDAPPRMESLLISNQIRSYCDQMDRFTGGGLSKLFLAGGLHKEEEPSAK
jgi:translation initiation factor 3 subunit H